MKRALIDMFHLPHNGQYSECSSYHNIRQSSASSFLTVYSAIEPIEPYVIPVTSPFGTLGGPHTRTTLSTAFGLKTSSGSIYTQRKDQVDIISHVIGVGMYVYYMHGQ